MSDGVLGLAALDEREAYRNFIDAMKVAESAAKQLAFYTQRKEWLTVEFALGTARERASVLAATSLRH